MLSLGFTMSASFEQEPYSSKRGHVKSWNTVRPTRPPKAKTLVPQYSRPRFGYGPVRVVLVVLDNAGAQIYTLGGSILVARIPQ